MRHVLSRNSQQLAGEMRWWTNPSFSLRQRIDYQRSCRRNCHYVDPPPFCVGREVRRRRYIWQLLRRRVAPECSVVHGSSVDPLRPKRGRGRIRERKRERSKRKEERKRERERPISPNHLINSSPRNLTELLRPSNSTFHVRPAACIGGNSEIVVDMARIGQDNIQLLWRFISRVSLKLKHTVNVYRNKWRVCV